MEFGIVILNYLNYKDTLEMIDSIEEQTYKNIPIVIVDNYSQNMSAKFIREKISDKNNYFFIESKDNVGFARGNNLGINYLREKLNIQNILLCNNDLIFSDIHYLEILSKLKFPNDIGAIGHKIIGSDKFNQNPNLWLYNQESIQKAIINFEVYDSINNSKNNYLLNNFLMNYLKSLRRQFLKRTASKKRENKKILLDREILHGACIMLTENYFDYFSGLYPETFLYGEEIILNLLLEKANLKKMYLDNLVVYHKEDQSSEMSFRNKSEILNKYRYDSNKVILKVYNLNISEVQKNMDQNI